MDGERPLACTFLVSHLPAEGGGEGGGRNRVLRRRRTTNLFARGKGEKRDRWKTDFFFDVDFDDFAPSLTFFLPFLFSCRGNIPSFFNFFVQVVFLLSKKIICWLRLVEKQAYITLFLYVVLKTQSRNFFVLYPFPKVLGLCSL